MRTMFTPLKIAGMEVKNRTFMAPMSLGYESQDGTVNEKMEAYWLRRAQGGVGCIIVDATSVDPNVPYLGNTLCFRDEESIKKYKSFTDKVHSYGCKIIPQITHPGPESISAFFGVAPVASSSYPNSMGQMTRELAKEELPGIVALYAKASKNAKEAGFDGIELHCAHAYMLLGSFLSPLRNKRTDEYGGSLLNRARLLFEVLDAIKETCGEDFPIVLRMSPEDILTLGIDGVNQIWRDAKLRAVGKARAKTLIEAAEHSVGSKEGAVSARMEIRMLLEDYESRNIRLQEVMGLIEGLVNQIPMAEKLLEIKGVGIKTVSGFLAEVGDIRRFNDPKELQKLAGLALVENSSGKHKGKTTISRRGRKRLRYLLFEVAMSLVAKNPEFRELHNYYTTRRLNPLKKMQSLMAIAAKLLRVFYAILTKGVGYDPKKMVNDIRRPAAYAQAA